MALVAPGVSDLVAFVVVKEPIFSAGNVAIVLIVEGLEVGRPNILVARLLLLKSSQGVGTHDGNGFLSGKAKMIFHETGSHGAIEMLIGEGFSLVGHVGFLRGGLAIL